MELNLYTWLIGALVTIVIVALVSKKITANLSKKGFKIHAVKDVEQKNNIIKIKGDRNKIIQDKNGKNVKSKQNTIEIEGNNQIINQDTQ